MIISRFKNKFFKNYYFVLSSIFLLHAFLRNGLMCLLPILLLFILKELNFKIIISSLISCLLLIEVGSSVELSLLTPNIIRYICFFIFTIYILSITKGELLKQVLTATLVLISQLISLTLTTSPYRSFTEAITMITYITIIINLGFRSINNDKFEIDSDPSDLIINLGYLYGISLLIGYQYLVISNSIEVNFLSNLSSVRGFILISLSLQLYKRGLKKSIPMIFITLLVCVFCAARTHVLMLFIITSLSVLNSIIKTIRDIYEKKIIKTLDIAFFSGFSVLIFVFLNNIFTSEFSIKTLGFLYTFAENIRSKTLDLSLIFLGVDPFRYFETREWINSGINTILFGNGIGSGINIRELLYVDIRSMGAYSINEINSEVAFTLHDIWTWYGLSIGLIGITILTLPMIFFNPFFKIKNYEKHFLKISLLLSFCTMWYSLSGNLLFWGTISILNNQQENKKYINR